MEGQAVSELIERIACETGANALGQMVHVEQLAAREAEYAIPSPPLPTPIQRALNLLGVEQLYSHQVESLERARRGENIVVVTATSSGKTLCYNLPILETILPDRMRGPFSLPINALITTQFKSLFNLNLGWARKLSHRSLHRAISATLRKAAASAIPTSG
jgi:DEAD/DEAH box helicase domain-containing protein